MKRILRKAGRSDGVWGAMTVVLVALSTFGLLGGCQSDSGFECGFAPDQDPANVRSCTGPNQVCVCRTRSCAELDPRADGDTCASRYRYLDEPFAHQDVANQCVKASDLGWEISTPGDRCSSVGQDASTSLDVSNDEETAEGETTDTDGASEAEAANDGANADAVDGVDDGGQE